MPSLTSRGETMDAITTAVLAALPALAVDAVKSAYESLKAVIRRKWGDAAPIAKAISALEQDPSSKAQAAVLQEKILAVAAPADRDVAQALHVLVEQLKARKIGGASVNGIQFNMSGGVVQGVAGADTVNIGSMTFGEPPKST
jgi:hypothetical protein